PGLLGRWGLNDGTGVIVTNSVAGSPDGTNYNSPAWSTDSPFTVVVVPQSVTLTNPVNNTSFPVGSSVTLAATATSTGTISKVEFFAGSSKVGESTTSPYTVEWFPSTVGTVALTAMVSDDTSLVTTSPVVNVVCYEAGTGALQFNGFSSYVTFGQATATLGTSNFTLECWFKRTGKGILASTGIGGTSGAPLIAKGVGEADASNRDANYFFGVDTSGRLVADFEEGSTGATIGLNHPIGGRNAIPNGVWTHAAVTYDGFTWVFYINGEVDATLDVNQPPRWDSIQHAAIGAAVNSGGVPQGFFEGAIDEARIWNYARSAQQISDSMNTSISAASGLLGRWSLDDSIGASATNSVAASPNGTLINNPVWCQGLSLVPATNTAPSIVLTSPADGSIVTGVATNLVVLTAFAADDGVVTNVTFYQGGLLLGSVTNSPFNLVWTNYTPGTYPLSATAVDDTGLSATSAVVNVTLIPPNYPPTISSRTPTNSALLMTLAPRLSVTVTDPEAAPLTVTFRGRPNVTNPPGADFTIVALPDTQFYNGQRADIYQAQTDWIIANRTALNIVYVGSLGDIVNDGDAKPSEWLAATNALYRLDDPALTGLPDGIPYGMVPGNHDHNNAFGGTSLYNTYFGVDHFINRPWYGGHLGSDNQNHYDLLTASGLEFVFVFIDFDYGYLDYTAVDPWSDSVLKTFPDRRAIVFTHDLLAISGAFDPRGQTIFDNLKNNQNLFLMLCGHNHGQYYRQDTVG
ncbi:MAG TPA: Ig-like domain-containing protein, partial [Methylomirabilota bacterium]|nr:Ig-like domain-containing protein [Methylomirabilota bacterium]